MATLHASSTLLIQSISTTLRLSRSLELLDNGLIVLNLLILVSPRATMGNYFNWQSDDRAAAVGSIES